jgi:hypothetical protein
MHRMRCNVAMVGLTLSLTASLGAVGIARADLIRPNASQAFPDLSGDIVGTQNYVYNPSTQTGTFQVNNTPTLLALGAKASSEYFVTDSPETVRSQSLQLKLDPNGRLLNDSGNSYTLYGTVSFGGKTYSGLLLQGTPTAFGSARQNPQTPANSVFDVNLTVNGGLLKNLYGPDAYLRIITGANTTFENSFATSFQGLNTITNVRAYNSPNPPTPVPEPSTLVVVLACGGAGILYRRKRRIPPRELSAPC